MDFVLKDLALRNRVPYVGEVSFKLGLNFIIGPPCSGKSTLIDVAYNNSYYYNQNKIKVFPVLPPSKILKVDFKTMKSTDSYLNVLIKSVLDSTASIDSELKVIQIVVAYLKETTEFSLVLFDNISYYLMHEQQGVVCSVLLKIPDSISVVIASLAQIKIENCRKITLECF